MANVAPTLDLNGADPGTSTAVSYTESDPDAVLAPAATVSDPDTSDFFGGSLIVEITSGAGTGDQIRIIMGAFTVEEGSLYYNNVPNGARIGSISGGSEGAPLTILFDQEVTAENGTEVTRAIVEELVRSVAYVNFSETPPAGTRTVTFTLSDGDGGTSDPVTSDVTLTAIDDPAVAQDDQFTAFENTVLTGNLFLNNGSGHDGDPDGTAIEVTSVNGDPGAVGQTITLASGAKLTVNPDGSFTYDPRGAFDLAHSASGAVNGFAADGFTYTITDGDDANVSITVGGEADAGDTYFGDASDNEIFGTSLRDIFRLEQGGSDIVHGLGGNDSFYFGGAFDSSDLANGGDGSDALILQGDYSAGITFERLGQNNIPGIESISLMPGDNETYVDSEGALSSYNLIFIDANVAAGATLRINGFYLNLGESLTVDGSAETDGAFQIFAGLCTDTLIGGARNDLFLFGHDGRFAEGDTVDGGAGSDVIYLRGDYAIDFDAPGFQGALTGIESIGLLSAADTSLAAGGDGEFDYSIALSDTVVSGGQMTVNGSRLGETESAVIDGSPVSSAVLRLFGGAAADVVSGGGGNDTISGGGGADVLAGNGGADVFRYHNVSESTPGAFDTILGFQSGVDRIDLMRIDADVHAAGDQAFRYVGDATFSGLGAASAGELRAAYNEDLDRWEVEGDVDGDGLADLMIVLPGAAPIQAGDFFL